MGQGAPGIVFITTEGINGKQFGGGGGGGVDIYTGNGNKGGDGAPGVVIVYEYY